MLDNHRIGGLLLMGGMGRRFGSDTPKQFHRLAGKPIFLHTLNAFLSANIFDEIILSCHADWIHYVQEMIPSSPIIHITPAGHSRQESSYRGLLAFKHPPSVVVIHDAVRPFVSREILYNNAKMALQFGAVDTCIPSTDTLVHAPNHRTIAEIPKRADYFRGQTPQSFSYPLILSAHTKTMRRDASDDCRLILDQGHLVHIVPGDESNMKITSELDLILAEQLLRLRLQNSTPLKTAVLTGKHFAIVGGTGGIGKAIVKKLISLGANAIPLSRTTTPSIDLRNSSSIKSAFCKIAKQVGPLDGLINCAGRLSINPVEKLALREIEETLNVNLKGLIFCCKMAPLKSGAHVINIASSSFSRGRKDMSIYSSAKAAVVNFTQAWSEERSDLHIHAIIPQRTNTSMRRQNFPAEDPTTLLDPEAVADAAVHLLTENNLTGLLMEVRKK